MDAWIATLLGVVVGGSLTGLFGMLQQRRAFEHEKSMWLLKNGSAETVKSLLMAMLEHGKYVERSFDALKQPIGGYTDDQIRQMLHEVGARRVERADGSEWWYLTSRSEERIERRNDTATEQS